MRRALRAEFIRHFGRGRQSIKDLAAKTGVCLRSLYSIQEGRPVSVDTFAAVLPHFPPDGQARIMESAGLQVQPMTGPGYTLGEAAAGMAGWNSEFLESYANDGRIDSTEERSLRRRLHKVRVLIDGFLRGKK